LPKSLKSWKNNRPCPDSPPAPNQQGDAQKRTYSKRPHAKDPAVGHIDIPAGFEKNTAQQKFRRYFMRTLKYLAIGGLAVLGIIAFFGSPVFAQKSPTQTVVYTLEPAEKILDAESTIAMSAEAEDVILILAKNEEQNPPYFVFRDGKKTGPYAKIGDAMSAAYEGREDVQGKRHECASYEPGEPPDDARPVTDYGAEGKQVIKFKGKSLGAYVMIFTTQATPDGAAAYYTASDNDKAWFGSSDGRVVSFGGIPGEFKFSPDGKNAAVLVQGKLSLTDMNNLSKLPLEKMAAVMQEQEKKYLYTIDGRSFGPFESSFESYSFWYAKSTNDLYYRVDDDVFRNGTLMFKAESFDNCQFYPSPDGKTYAMYTYESILFSDGQSFPSPLDVVVLQHAGKTVFRWIALENEKKLVIYERTM
jgi:hypothetical protein